MSTEFAWIDSYTKIATALREYKTKQHELLRFIYNMFDEMPELNNNLTDIDGDNTVNFEIIDPFTVMGIFNRPNTPNKRQSIIDRFIKFLKIEAKAPEIFDGIPVIKEIFFEKKNNVRNVHIAKMWELFEVAINLADKPTDEAETLFCELFNFVVSQPESKWNTTCGLFWIRPYTYISLDINTRNYLNNELNLSYPINDLPNGKLYLKRCSEIQTQISSASHINSFPALTNDALVLSKSQSADPERKAKRVPSTTVKHDDRSTGSPGSTYNLQSIRGEGCFVPEATLVSMLKVLHDKKNIILQGPPGTGKTWLAKRLAWALVGERRSARVQALQFHATLSYEDFVCGWRPVGEGKLDLVDGPFLEALAEANKNPNTPYVLVIEEINRGNPAQIFGEMLTLLEADKRIPEEALRLCYQKNNECRPVHLPANLYLIGTMNIADRSLAIVDFALRRRFAFYTLAPHFGDEWQKWMRDRAGLPEDFITALADAMQTCNTVIANDTSLGPQYAIGHSFVTCDTPIENPRAWIEGIVDAEIAPLLKEYWFNDLDKAQKTAQDILDALP